jgi:anti-sigma-K factor RskA
VLGEWNDERIERAFAEWRATEMRDVPPFDKMHAQARHRAATADAMRLPSGAWRWVAAAAAVFVAIGVGSFVLHQRRGRSPGLMSRTPNLSDWRSPTAFLLQGTGDALITTVPTVSTATIELKALGVSINHRRPL